MKMFRYFILVVTGVAAVMLGGCKDKEKYDESAFQDDLEPLSEDEVEAMDQNGDDEMAVADESDLEQLQDSENGAGAGDMQQTRRAKRNWMKMAPIQIKMKWPSTFMSMAMYPPILLLQTMIMQTVCFR